MIEHLRKLADYLDGREYHLEANIVDIFINKNAAVSENFPADTIWSHEPTYSGDMDTPLMPPERGGKDEADLLEAMGNHPLGQKILKYLKDVFILCDSGAEGVDGMKEISLKDMNAITREAYKYNEDWNIRQEGEAPASPNSLRKLLEESAKSYSKSYKNSGSIDSQAIREWLHAVYKQYEVLYLKKYMREDTSPMIRDERYYQSGTEELSPEKYEALMQLQDQKMAEYANEAWLDQVARETDPEAYQENLKNYRKKEDFQKLQLLKKRDPNATFEQVRQHDDILYDD